MYVAAVCVAVCVAVGWTKNVKVRGSMCVVAVFFQCVLQLVGLQMSKLVTCPFFISFFVHIYVR